MSIPQPPMALFLGDNLIGQIVTYGYETPWASGKMEEADNALIQRLIALCELFDESETWSEAVSVEADNQRWEIALSERGLAQTDADHYSSEPWRIQTKDGIQHELSALPVFDQHGFVTWRW